MQIDFLMCSERSGSNLITKVINGHPDICGPFPSHLFKTFCYNYYRYGDLRVDSNWETLLTDAAFYMDRLFSNWRSEITLDVLRKRVKERSLAAIGRVVYEYEAEANGKKQIFVKENQTYSFAAYLLSHFPDAKFVYHVRDARDMAATWRRLQKKLPRLPKAAGVQTAAPIWQSDQAGSIKVLSYLRDSGRGLLVHFEDLVTKPEEQAQRICEFLGVPYSQKMLEFHKDPLVVQNAMWNDAWSDMQKPLLSENRGIYKKILTETEIRYVEAVCAEEMEYFGYKRDFDPVGSVEELAAELPDEASLGEEPTEAELKGFVRYPEALERVQSRALHLAG